MTGRVLSVGEKIRIIYLISHLGLGGSERQLYLLLKHLDKRVFEPHVVVFNPSPYVVLNDDIEKLGMKVYAIPKQCTGIWRRTGFLYRLFRSLSPHIVHSWTVHDNPYVGLIGWLAGVPVRWGSVRGSIYLHGFQSLPSIYRWLSLHTVSSLTVNAQSIVDELRAQKYPSNHIVLLPNCVEMVPISRTIDLESMGIALGDRLVGAVGNLRRLKKHDMFIDVMAKALPEHPGVRGLIVGQPVPHESNLPEQLAGQIKRLGLDGRVILAGFYEDTPALMARFSVLCLTSESEGMPNAILEAMAAARPVVATRVGGVPELVEDGVTGYLIEPGDVDGFASAVRRLLDDPELAERMGHAGREKAAREFSCEQAVQRLADLYMTALKAKSIYHY